MTYAPFRELVRVSNRILLASTLILWPLAAIPAQAKGIGETGDCTRSTMYWLLKDVREQFGIRDEFNRFKDADQFGISPTDTEYSIRRHLVAFCKDEDQRKELKRALLQDMKNESRRIKDLVAKAFKSKKIDPQTQVYDIITIGSGPEGVVFDYNLVRENPNLKHLTIEASSGIATTFDTAGFRLNSLNRPGTQNQVSAKGVGNQNALPGCPLQIPDFSPSAYPVARDLADVSTINRAMLKESPVLFETEAYRVEFRELTGADAKKWPADYKITTSTGIFYTDHLVISTGLGRELDLSGFDGATQSFFKAERERVAQDPTIAPIFDSVAGYFRYKNTNGRAFENYANEEILLIGAGDSGNTFIEDALGFAPNDSYGGVSAQQGRPKEITWAGQDKTTCEALLNSLRSRYSGAIVGGFRSKIVKPTKNKVVAVVQQANGKLLATFSNGNSRVFDRVFVATGFADGSPDLLTALAPTDLQGRAFGRQNPFRESSALKPVVIDGAQYADNTVPHFTAGKQLICTIPGPLYGTPLNIYVTAPAAGKLVSDADLRGVDANVVSLFNNAPRTRGLARYLANIIQPRAPRAPAAVSPGFRIEGTNLSEFGIRDYRMEFKPTKINQRPGRLSELSLKSQLTAIFRNVEVAETALPGRKLNIRFFQGQGSGFLVRIEPGLSMDDELDILSRIRVNSDILSELDLLLGGPGSPQIANFELEIGTVPSGKKYASFAPSKTKVTYSRVPRAKLDQPFGPEVRPERMIKARDNAPVVSKRDVIPEKPPLNYVSQVAIDLNLAGSPARFDDTLTPLKNGGFVISDSGGSVRVYTSTGALSQTVVMQPYGKSQRTILELKNGQIAVANPAETVIINNDAPQSVVRASGREQTLLAPKLFESDDGYLYVGYPSDRSLTDSEIYRLTSVNGKYSPEREILKTRNYNADSIFTFSEQNIAVATGAQGGLVVRFINPNSSAGSVINSDINFANSTFIQSTEKSVFIGGVAKDGSGVIYDVTVDSPTQTKTSLIASNLSRLEGSRPVRLSKDVIAFPGQSIIYFLDNDGRRIFTQNIRRTEFRKQVPVPLFPNGGFAITSEAGELFLFSNSYTLYPALARPEAQYINSSLTSLKNGMLAVAATDGKIRIFDPARVGQITDLRPQLDPVATIDVSPNSPMTAITRIAELQDGTLVVSTSDRIYYLKPSQ